MYVLDNYSDNTINLKLWRDWDIIDPGKNISCTSPVVIYGMMPRVLPLFLIIYRERDKNGQYTEKTLLKTNSMQEALDNFKRLKNILKAKNGTEQSQTMISAQDRLERLRAAIKKTKTR